MRESRNTAFLIANCVQTEPKTHMLYRGYGVSSTDSARMPTRSAVSSQAARWYPDARIGKVHVESVESNGHVHLAVEVL